VEAALVAWRVAEVNQGIPAGSGDDPGGDGDGAGDGMGSSKEAGPVEAAPLQVGVDASGRVWVAGQTSLLRQAAEAQLVSMVRWHTPERLRTATKYLLAVIAPHLAEEHGRQHAEQAEREAHRDRYLILTP